METKQRVVFEDLTGKPVCVEFAVPEQTSDAGVVLLKVINGKMGSAERMAAALRDPRDASAPLPAGRLQ